MFPAGTAPVAGAAMRRSLRTAAASDKETGKGSAPGPAPGWCTHTALPSRQTRRANTSPLALPGEVGSHSAWHGWSWCWRRGWVCFSTPSREILLGSWKRGSPSAGRLSLCFPTASESRRESDQRSQTLVSWAPLKLTWKPRPYLRSQRGL